MIFVYGGQTVNINIPLGKFVMKYCTGKDWYGYKELFGTNGSYSKSKDLFDFNIDKLVVVEYVRHWSDYFQRVLV